MIFWNTATYIISLHQDKLMDNKEVWKAPSQFNGITVSFVHIHSKVITTDIMQYSKKLHSFHITPCYYHQGQVYKTIKP